MTQFVKERKIHFKDNWIQDISSSILEWNWGALKIMNKSILEPKPHIQEALEKLGEKRQLLHDKENFWNQKKFE